MYGAVIIDNTRECNVEVGNLINKYFAAIISVNEVTTIDKALASIISEDLNIIIVNNVYGDNSIIELLKNSIVVDNNCQVIIIDKNSSFALKAFKNKASDFLLKPIEENHLVNALNKAIKNINLLENQKAVNTGIVNYKSSKFISISNVLYATIIDVDKILYCEAIGQQTIFYTKDNTKYISNKHLGKYNWLLSNKFFFRIHNRYLVNLNRVSRIERVGGVSCVLFGKVSLPISTRKYPMLYNFLKLKS